MTTGDPVSRYELDDLRRIVQGNQQRLDEIDRSGTRGVAVLAIQIAELSKDFAKHEERHEQDQRARDQEKRDAKTSRKWWVMAAVAAIGAIDGPLVTLILQHGH
jgi:hypothetical protein